MTKFKVGDRVKCIESYIGDTSAVEKDRIYTIHSTRSNAMCILKETGGANWRQTRFELVEEECVTMLQPTTKKRGSLYRFRTKHIHINEIELSRNNPVSVVSIDERTDVSFVLIHASLVQKAIDISTSLAIGILTDELHNRDVHKCTKKEAKKLVRLCKEVYHAPWPDEEMNVSVLTVNMQG